MSRKKTNSRALRRLAEELIQRIAGDAELPDDEREGFVTSLVRQWITYDGNAVVFVGEQPVYLVLGKTPLGKPLVIPEPGLPGGMKRLARDWKVNSDDLPEVIDQLNRGQSAEVINGDGIPLRFWVNPKERSLGVEQLVEVKVPPGTERDHRKIAADMVEEYLGAALDPKEMDDLACSVAKQWQQYSGHACLFLSAHQQLSLKFKEHGDGTCNVACGKVRVELGPVLASYGFSPEVVGEVIARINLGQEIEFQDGQGGRNRLWHDPKERRICVKRLDVVQPAVRDVMPPFLCPKCTAVLSPWWEGVRQQTCPLCGHLVSLP